MGIALLDSNTVMGFLDAVDLLHAVADRAVREAAAEHLLAVSVVTVAELLTGAKLGHHEDRLVRSFFARSIARRMPLDEPAAERAAELRAADRTLRMPDALILATADLNADVAITGDRQWLKANGLSCEVRLLTP